MSAHRQGCRRTLSTPRPAMAHEPGAHRMAHPWVAEVKIIEPMAPDVWWATGRLLATVRRRRRRCCAPPGPYPGEAGSACSRGPGLQGPQILSVPRDRDHRESPGIDGRDHLPAPAAVRRLEQCVATGGVADGGRPAHPPCGAPRTCVRPHQAEARGGSDHGRESGLVKGTAARGARPIPRGRCPQTRPRQLEPRPTGGAIEWRGHDLDRCGSARPPRW